MNWPDSCEYCWEGNPPEAHIILERGGSRNHTYLCRKCFLLYNDKMRRTAAEVRRKGSTLVTGYIRSRMAGMLLYLVDLLMRPTEW